MVHRQHTVWIEDYSSGIIIHRRAGDGRKTRWLVRVREKCGRLIRITGENLKLFDNHCLSAIN